MGSSQKAVDYLPIDQFFPLETPREKQLTALSFIEKSVQNGYRDIVISAPTGSGKTGTGVAACFWGAQNALTTLIPGIAGGYYLTAQKMLQDQLETDLVRFKPGLQTGASLKSASEYACPTFKSCSIGVSQHKLKKSCSLGNNCCYKRAKETFLNAPLAITNYPYFLTERTHVGRLPQRRVLICDEAHSLERNLLRFVDLVVSENTLPEWAPTIDHIPELPTLNDFTGWVCDVYFPVIKSRAEGLADRAQDLADEKAAHDLAKIDHHVSKVATAVNLIQVNPTDWIYWQSKDANGQLESIARPLNAAPFMPLIRDMGGVRIYMSAFPGQKSIFCRSLGLELDKVAWCGLSSTFPIENRPIVIGSVGSMSRKNLEASLPKFLVTVEKILAKHKNEKGLIHCVSYALGKIIFNHLKAAHGERLIFPQNANDRDDAFAKHCQSQVPTVLITPSMTEGFDFVGDLARWQIIAKIPYPSLGDQQIVAKKNQDPDWYLLETCKSIIQAAGRIVRSDEDRGFTYILDSDFDRLYAQCADFFPNWFKKAFVYPRRSSS